MLFNDGPTFLGLARLIDAGEWRAVIAHPYHPLYPLAIRLAQPVTGDWERAAVAVSVLSGAAAVAALFVLLRDGFGRRTAAVGALILAVHPRAVACGSDVQSDGLYLALFVGSAAALWRGLVSGRRAPAAAAGALAGLAYLTRPEGAVLLAAALLLATLELRAGRWRVRAAALWCAAALATALLVMAPYVVALRAHTGSWVLTQKKSLAALSGLAPGAGGIWQPGAAVAPERLAANPFLETVVRGPRRPPLGEGAPAPPTGLRRAARATRELFDAAISTLRFELAPLLLLGALSLPRPPGRRAAFVLGFAALHVLLLGALALAAGYVSRRHALPPIALCLGYVALGATRAGGWLAARVGASGPRTAAALGAALVVAAEAPAALGERRPERLAERRAAEWLAARPERAGAVAASKQRVAYYAGAAYVPLPRAGAPVAAYLRAADAGYMIVDESYLEAHPEVGEAAREMMRVVHRVEANGRRAAVFAIGRVH